MPVAGDPRRELDTSATLEIRLTRSGVDQYLGEFRFTSADDGADRVVRGTEPIRFDAISGSDAVIDPHEVGALLRKGLLADPLLAAEFRRVMTAVEVAGQLLHVRLFLDASTAELQLLPWEALFHPDRDEFLFLGERIGFSRYLPSADFRPVPPLARGKLTASIMIANPKGLESYRLAPLDVAGWRAAAAAALQEVSIRAEGPATLAAIVDEVRKGCDILYIACHGSIHSSDPVLWLENEQGEIDRVDGRRLVEELRALRALPRLILLFSCDSAGDDMAFHAAVGPALAEAGVPAVVAMRGKVPMDAGSGFVAALLGGLGQHGVIHHAVAVARRAVDAGDALIPMLFSRLRGGRIWQRPGFLSGQGQYADRWRVLVDRLNDGQCVPIIGSGIAEPLFGPTRELARRWAEEYGFPLAPHARDNLVQVAQYLVISQDANLPRSLLEKHIKAAIAPYLGQSDQQLSLLEQIDNAWLRFAEGAPSDPFAQLAKLPFPLFITTNSDGLIEQALRRAGRDPVSEVCRWDGRDRSPTVFERDPNYTPTPERPLVYHLFRQLRQEDGRFPRALLTEDDYFDYLLGVTNRRELIPSKVRYALTDRALLFLGFQIDEIDFRVLFRSIINQESLDIFRSYNHVAVQIDPEEGQILEPSRARRYLESYFRELANVGVYWGSSGDFVGAMFKEWDERTLPRIAVSAGVK